MTCWVAQPFKEKILLPLNTCKVKITKNNQTIVSNGVSCTNDVDLHIHLLNLSTPTQTKGLKNEKNNR
jgi:hypothetical protein